MNWNRFTPALCALALALTGGCKKSTPSDQPATLNPLPPAASIHWLGMKRIAADTNAASFLTVWNLPETAKLKTQTLDKLTAWLTTEAGREKTQKMQKSGKRESGKAETGGAALIRPLLDDLVEEEWHLEIYAAPAAASSLQSQPSTPPAWSLAVRLNEQRAALWQTNLAPLVQRVEDGGRRAEGGGQQRSEDGGRRTEVGGRRSEVGGQKSEDGSHLRVFKSGEWTIVTFGSATAPVGSALPRPSSASASNFWLEASFDLGRLAGPDLQKLLTSPQTPGLPKVALTFTGEGDHVRTRGQLDFDRPLALELEPWKLPLSLMSQPLTSFTAVRGFRPWLAALKTWSGLDIGEPPNQIYWWANEGAGVDSYFAAPQPIARKQVAQVSDLVIEKWGPQEKTNDFAKFVRAKTFHGLEWQVMGFVSPFLQSLETNGQAWVFGGLFPVGVANPLPAELLSQITNQPALVAYEWELTSLKAPQWLYNGQFFRFVTGKAQMLSESAGLAWVTTAPSNVVDCASSLIQSGPSQLAFNRKSSIGLTALEMHLLADWLESPTFPRGLRSFTAPPQ